jgi:hypothetical protein
VIYDGQPIGRATIGGAETVTGGLYGGGGTIPASQIRLKPSMSQEDVLQERRRMGDSSFMSIGGGSNREINLYAGGGGGGREVNRESDASYNGRAQRPSWYSNRSNSYDWTKVDLHEFKKVQVFKDYYVLHTHEHNDAEVENEFQSSRWREEQESKRAMEEMRERVNRSIRRVDTSTKHISLIPESALREQVPVQVGPVKSIEELQREAAQLIVNSPPQRLSHSSTGAGAVVVNRVSEMVPAQSTTKTQMYERTVERHELQTFEGQRVPEYAVQTVSTGGGVGGAGVSQSIYESTYNHQQQQRVEQPEQRPNTSAIHRSSADPVDLYATPAKGTLNIQIAEKSPGTATPINPTYEQTGGHLHDNTNHHFSGQDHFVSSTMDYHLLDQRDTTSGLQGSAQNQWRDTLFDSSSQQQQQQQFDFHQRTHNETHQNQLHQHNQSATIGRTEHGDSVQGFTAFGAPILSYCEKTANPIVGYTTITRTKTTKTIEVIGTPPPGFPGFPGVSFPTAGPSGAATPSPGAGPAATSGTASRSREPEVRSHSQQPQSSGQVPPVFNGQPDSTRPVGPQVPSINTNMAPVYGYSQTSQHPILSFDQKGQGIIGYTGSRTPVYDYLHGYPATDRDQRTLIIGYTGSNLPVYGISPSGYVATSLSAKSGRPVYGLDEEGRELLEEDLAEVEAFVRSCPVVGSDQLGNSVFGTDESGRKVYTFTRDGKPVFGYTKERRQVLGFERATGLPVYWFLDGKGVLGYSASGNAIFDPAIIQSGKEQIYFPKGHLIQNPASTELYDVWGRLLSSSSTSQAPQPQQVQPGVVPSADRNTAQIFDRNGFPIRKGDKIFDAQGNSLPERPQVTNRHGQPLGPDSRVLGPDGTELTPRGTRADEKLTLSKPIFDHKGNQIGTMDSHGQVLSSRGQVIGTVTNSGKLESILPIEIISACKVVNNKVVDARGVEIGRVESDGTVVDGFGILVGRVDPTGRLVPDLKSPEQIEILKKAANAQSQRRVDTFTITREGLLQSSTGNIIGRVQPSTNQQPGSNLAEQRAVINEQGQIIAFVTSSGDILSANKTQIGKVSQSQSQPAGVAESQIINTIYTITSEGLIDNRSGKSLGVIVPSQPSQASPLQGEVKASVIDQTGKIVAHLLANGEVISSIGQAIGRSNVAASNLPSQNQTNIPPQQFTHTVNAERVISSSNGQPLGSLQIIPQQSPGIINSDILGLIVNQAGKTSGTVTSDGLIISPEGQQIGRVNVQTIPTTSITQNPNLQQGQPQSLATHSISPAGLISTLAGHALGTFSPIPPGPVSASRPDILGLVVDHNGQPVALVSVIGDIVSTDGQVVGKIDLQKPQQPQGPQGQSGQQQQPGQQQPGLQQPQGQQQLPGQQQVPGQQQTGLQQPGQQQPQGQQQQGQVQDLHQTVFTITSQGTLSSPTGQPLGSLTPLPPHLANPARPDLQQAVVDAMGQIVALVTEKGEVLGLDGKPAGTIGAPGQGQTQQNSSQQAPTLSINPQGFVVAQDGAYFGKTSDDLSSLGTLGIQDASKAIQDQNGKVIGYVTKTGQLLNLEKRPLLSRAGQTREEPNRVGALTYSITTDGSVTTSDGKTLGKVSGLPSGYNSAARPDVVGSIVDQNGNTVGLLTKLGELISADGSVVAKQAQQGTQAPEQSQPQPSATHSISPAGFISTLAGHTLGTFSPIPPGPVSASRPDILGLVVDHNGQPVALVSVIGDIVSTDGQVVGKIDLQKPQQPGQQQPQGTQGLQGQQQQPGQPQLPGQQQQLGQQLPGQQQQPQGQQQQGQVQDLHQAVFTITSQGTLSSPTGQPLGSLTPLPPHLANPARPDLQQAVVDAMGQIVALVTEKGEVLGLDGKPAGTIGTPGRGQTHQPNQVQGSSVTLTPTGQVTLPSGQSLGKAVPIPNPTSMPNTSHLTMALQDESGQTIAYLSDSGQLFSLEGQHITHPEKLAKSQKPEAAETSERKLERYQYGPTHTFNPVTGILSSAEDKIIGKFVDLTPQEKMTNQDLSGYVLDQNGHKVFYVSKDGHLLGPNKEIIGVIGSAEEVKAAESKRRADDLHEEERQKAFEQHENKIPSTHYIDETTGLLHDSTTHEPVGIVKVVNEPHPSVPDAISIIVDQVGNFLTYVMSSGALVTTSGEIVGHIAKPQVGKSATESATLSKEQLMKRAGTVDLEDYFLLDDENKPIGKVDHSKNVYNTLGQIVGTIQPDGSFKAEENFTGDLNVKFLADPSGKTIAQLTETKGFQLYDGRNIFEPFHPPHADPSNPEAVVRIIGYILDSNKNLLNEEGQVVGKIEGNKIFNVEGQKIAKISPMGEVKDLSGNIIDILGNLFNDKGILLGHVNLKSKKEEFIPVPKGTPVIADVGGHKIIGFNENGDPVIGVDDKGRLIFAKAGYGKDGQLISAIDLKGIPISPRYLSNLVQQARESAKQSERQASGAATNKAILSTIPVAEADSVDEESMVPHKRSVENELVSDRFEEKKPLSGDESIKSVHEEDEHKHPSDDEVDAEDHEEIIAHLDGMEVDDADREAIKELIEKEEQARINTPRSEGSNEDEHQRMKRMLAKAESFMDVPLSLIHDEAHPVNSINADEAKQTLAKIEEEKENLEAEIKKASAAENSESKKKHRLAMEIHDPLTVPEIHSEDMSLTITLKVEPRYDPEAIQKQLEAKKLEIQERKKKRKAEAKLEKEKEKLEKEERKKKKKAKKEAEGVEEVPVEEVPVVEGEEKPKKKKKKAVEGEEGVVEGEEKPKKKKKKVAEGEEPAVAVEGEEKPKKKKKKVAEGEDAAADVAVEGEEKPKKKKKKAVEGEEPAVEVPAEGEEKPKKKKKKAVEGEVPAEIPAEGEEKPKKKKKIAAEEETQPAPEAEEKPKKKKKKPEAGEEQATVEVPTLGGEEKPKKKKKAAEGEAPAQPAEETLGSGEKPKKKKKATEVAEPLPAAVDPLGSEEKPKKKKKKADDEEEAIMQEVLAEQEKPKKKKKNEEEDEFKALMEGLLADKEKPKKKKKEEAIVAEPVAQPEEKKKKKKKEEEAVPQPEIMVEQPAEEKKKKKKDKVATEGEPEAPNPEQGTEEKKKKKKKAGEEVPPAEEIIALEEVPKKKKKKATEEEAPVESLVERSASKKKTGADLAASDASAKKPSSSAKKN